MCLWIFELACFFKPMGSDGATGASTTSGTSSVATETGSETTGSSGMTSGTVSGLTTGMPDMTGGETTTGNGTTTGTTADMTTGSTTGVVPSGLDMSCMAACDKFFECEDPPPFPDIDSCKAECTAAAGDQPGCIEPSSAFNYCLGGLSCQEFQDAWMNENFGPCTDEFMAMVAACNCAGLDLNQCMMDNTCVAISGEKINVQKLCLAKPTFLECVPAMACGDTVTIACPIGTTEPWQFPDTCIPEGYELCDSEPVGAPC